MTRASGARRDPIRVCYLIDALTTAGTETQLLALIRHLDRTRVHPFLCLLRPETDSVRALEPDDCPVRYLGIRSLHHPRTLTRLWRLARFLRRERVDVLQVYFPDSTYVGVVAACLAGVPHLVRTRNNLGHWLTRTHRRLGRLLRPFVSATIANCQACRQAVLRDEGADPESVVVLENGVDLTRFPEEHFRPLARRAGPRRVGVVANLRPIKALDVFVDAAAIVAADHPDVEFHVAGDGELRETLERQAVERGIAAQLHLRGPVGDIPAFLRDLDVAVLCSRAEGMSNALLEYMAAARPLVATHVGAAEQLVENGVHGLLVPPGNPQSLAEAIDRLLRDPGLAARLGSAARRRVEERYTRPVMVRRFEAFYEDLVGGRLHGREPRPNHPIHAA